MVGFSASKASMSCCVILCRTSEPHQLKRRVTGQSDAAGELPLQPVRASAKAANTAAVLGRVDFRARKSIRCPLVWRKATIGESAFWQLRCDACHRSRTHTKLLLLTGEISGGAAEVQCRAAGQRRCAGVQRRRGGSSVPGAAEAQCRARREFSQRRKPMTAAESIPRAPVTTRPVRTPNSSVSQPASSPPKAWPPSRSGR